MISHTDLDNLTYDNITLPDLEKYIPNRLNSFFQLYLNQTSSPAPLLQEAMSYSLMNGGKRIRPLLVYAVGRLFGATWENCDIAACAIELIHTYSLVHDDLPSMDNADLRRGKLSCHKQFSPAIATLAGDTLQTLAFQVIAQHPGTLSADQRIRMVEILAEASGYKGMGAGQTLDLQGMTTPEEIEHMYTLKTGALLEASVLLGLCVANIHDINIFHHLKKFAQRIGLAFQIQDDLLDRQNETITGKPQHLDTVNNKLTYADLLGIEKTRLKIDELFADAVQSAQALEEKGILLIEIAFMLMHRQK